MEPRHGTTTSQPLQMKSSSRAEWADAPKPSRWQSLTKNTAVAAALLICVAALRSGAIPPLSGVTEAVLTAASHDTLLDDQLGRLTFVSRLFPEATLVFGESTLDASLAWPVSGGTILQAWSEEQPYAMLSADDRRVYSAIDGEVMGVYHGEDEELLVHVLRSDGLSVVCGNLAGAAVSVGDAVTEGMLLGHLADGAACSLEVRRDGRSVDPAILLRP